MRLAARRMRWKKVDDEISVSIVEATYKKAWGDFATHEIAFRVDGRGPKWRVDIKTMGMMPWEAIDKGRGFDSEREAKDYARRYYDGIQEQGQIMPTIRRAGERRQEAMSDNQRLRSKVIRLAHDKPELRKDLLPVLKQAADMSVWKRLRPGDVFSVGTGRFMDPAMVVQYWGDEDTMPPYDQGMLVARKVSPSTSFWIFPEGGNLVIENNNTGRKQQVQWLEPTGEKERPYHRRASQRQARMSHEAEDLQLYLENDYEIYSRHLTPTLKNLMRHWRKGRFDRTQATKAFMYVVDAAAKKYHREMGTGPQWFHQFPKPVRQEVANSMAEDFEDQAEYGEYDHL